jgi:hypothetical protein
MNKRILCILFFVLTITKISSQEINFSWSLGDFGWSYNFIGKYDVFDFNILKFNVSFEKVNVMISTSIMSGTSKNNRAEMEPFYNYFFPLEIIYSPFKWKYVHISIYGRGLWEIGYNGPVENPNVISDGFFGNIGIRIGLFPIESNLFKYKSHIVNIFSEYTLRNEYKLGISIDIFDIIYIGFQVMLQEAEEKNRNRY